LKGGGACVRARAESSHGWVWWEGGTVWTEGHAAAGANGIDEMAFGLEQGGSGGQGAGRGGGEGGVLSSSQLTVEHVVYQSRLDAESQQERCCRNRL
jgi:hypothetical protein